MKNSLHQSLLNRLKNKHAKLTSRFRKSIEGGSFQKLKYAKKKDSVSRIKNLEKRIKTIAKESGIEVSLNYKHWALALAMGVIFSASAQQDKKKTFSEKLRNSVSHIKSSQSLAQTVFFSDPIKLGESYLAGLPTGDIDGDGDIDALYVSYTDVPIILENQGALNFITRELTSNNLDIVFNANLADFDGDGDLDVFIRSGSYNQPSNYFIFTNDGIGNFSSQPATVDFGSYASGNLILSGYDFAFPANLDADADLEYIALQIENQTYQAYLAVFDQSNFNFVQTAQLKGTSGTFPTVIPIAVLDIDGDTDLDIAYTGYRQSIGNPLQFFINDGTGQFTDSGSYTTLTTFLEDEGAALDFDGDGDMDIVATASNFPPAVRPFINDGGGFSEAGLLYFTNNESIDEITATDIDGDGNDDFVVNTDRDSTFVMRSNGADTFSRLASLKGQSKPANLDTDGDADLFRLQTKELSIAQNLGGGSFSSGQPLLTINSSYASQLADFDNDGDLDLAQSDDYDFRIYRNDGNANLDLIFTGEVTNGGSDEILEVGDIDGDGDIDIIISGRSYSGFYLFPNTGSAAFSNPTQFASGYTIEALQVADMDGDGDSDVVVAQYLSSIRYLSVFINNGSGNLVRTFDSSIPVGNDFDMLTVGDVDGDGDQDIVAPVENYNQGSQYGVFVYVNDGTGNITRGTDIIPLTPDVQFSDVDLADLDGDGDLDVFVTNSTSPGSYSPVFLNDGTGVFTENGAGVYTDYSYRSALGDIDSDGDFDIISGAYLGNPKLFINDGLGNFTLDSQLPVISDEYSNALFGDLDGDSDVDVIITGYYSSTKILLNVGAVPENQEINIQGNGVTILAGDTTPSIEDGTDFGTVQVGNSKTSTFIIQNQGLADLEVNDITVTATDGINDVSPDFQISGISLPTIIGGESFRSFSLTYTPEVAAVISGSVLVLNNDSDESSYPFGITATAEGTLPPPDSLALVALYNETDGANWINNANWLEGPISTWFGITTVDGAITEVALNSNNLTGTIPNRIDDLSSLSALNLEFNNLSGPLPSELGRLDNLTFVNLRGNEFTGSIPVEIGDLLNLTVLDLGQNQFSEAIPSEIGNLINLNSLDIDENQLSGPIPPEFVNLINLNFLNIRSNLIDGLPDLTGLPLTSFDVSFNRIPDEDIALNASVITLNLGQDVDFAINEQDSLALVALYDATNGDSWTNNTNWKQSGQKVETWFGITVVEDRVTAIDLNTNELNGEVPTQIGDLTALESIDLRFNSLSSSTILNDLLNISPLRNLLLSGNQFSGTLPNFSVLPNLEFLILDQNQFSGIIPATIGNNLSLLALNLGDNLFEGTIPPEIGNLENLFLLRIWSMEDITGNIPPEIGNLTSLQEIDFGFLNLEGTIPASLGNLLNLEILYLNDNNLTGAIPGEIAGLSNLTNISILNNAIDSIPNLSGLPSLIDLRVQENNLSFDDIEPNVGIPGFVYSPQNTIVPLDMIFNGGLVFNAIDTVARAESEVIISVSSGIAPNNNYVWSLNGGTLATQIESSLTIPSMSRSDVGDYSLAVTNTVATGLTLTAEPVELLANAVISVEAQDVDTEVPISERVNAYLFPLGEALGDTITFSGELNPGILNSTSTFSFPEVLLDDYLLAVESVIPITDGNGNQNPDATYVPTFYGDVFLSEEADVLVLNKDTTLIISMVEFPEDEDPGEGALSGTIEEDFGDEEARVDARRRAKRRKCGLRRRRTGGRTGQNEDFELFAYGETNDQGEFEFGFLPEGTYRFFVEYPGIPLDPEAEVEFVVGEEGLSDDTFTLEVFATPEGIEIEFILGIASDYFVDFNIYPNPTVNLLTIEYAGIKTSKVMMEVVAMDGKVLMNKVIDKRKNKLLIYTSTLKPGQYLIRFRGGSNKKDLVYRMIKK